MRIIGVDPGTYCTGYGLIDVNNGNINYIYSGCIKSNCSLFYNRLKEMYLSILNVFLCFKPKVLAIEKNFFYKNSNSFCKLNQINGVIILAAINNFLSVFEYNVSMIRKSVVFKGNANKNYVNKVVCNILGLNLNLDLNITDALAVAITHFNYNYKI